MDNYSKRKTKKDKAKRNKELNGKYSQKHMRQLEALKENPKIKNRKN
jgi:hypothetical protein